MLIGTQLKRLLSLAVVALPLASLHGQTRWTIEQRPVLEIEDESQGESTLFTNIVHVEQLRTGELLVVDGATRELRFFSASGRFLRKAGRNGAGPGEFRELSGISVAQDQIHVFDGSQMRITRFDLSGRLTSTIAVAEPSDSRRGIWSYNLGGFIEGRPVFLASGFPGRNSAPRRYTDSLPQYIYSIDAKAARPIGEMAVMDAYFESPQKKGDLIFGRFSTSAVGGGRLYVTDGGQFAVRVYDKDGRRVMTMGRAFPMARVSESDLDAYVTLRMRFASDKNRNELRELLAAIPRAEYRPSIARLLVDDYSNLWVQHWSVPGAVPTTWSILSESGQFLTELSMPAGFQPMTIRGDVLSGIIRDDDDVESIRLLRVRRGRY